jgi:hypothetical protein
VGLRIGGCYAITARVSFPPLAECYVNLVPVLAKQECLPHHTGLYSRNYRSDVYLLLVLHTVGYRLSATYLAREAIFFLLWTVLAGAPRTAYYPAQSGAEQRG